MSSAPFEEGFSSDLDSGFHSGGQSRNHTPNIFFAKPHLKFINQQLQHLEPQDILKWCISTLPNLYQETAFGLTGLTSLDMLSKISATYPLKREIPLIFIDTLHHFPQTFALLGRVAERYPHSTINVFRPEGVSNAQEFAAKYGERLWETDEETYDFQAKIEPTERAYSSLGVEAVITGRRRTQGGKRGALDIVEVDENGVIKVNPLANWTFDQVQAYIRDNDVPYNELLDQGYKSIGDWHSTQPVKEGEGERDGRWKGQDKTECGIHNPKSRYAQYLLEMEQKAQREKLEEAFSRNFVLAS